jgi:hypothetical protein
MAVENSSARVVSRWFDFAAYRCAVPENRDNGGLPHEYVFGAIVGAIMGDKLRDFSRNRSLHGPGVQTGVNPKL